MAITINSYHNNLTPRFYTRILLDPQKRFSIVKENSLVKETSSTFTTLLFKCYVAVNVTPATSLNSS